MARRTVIVSIVVLIVVSLFAYWYRQNQNGQPNKQGNPPENMEGKGQFSDQIIVESPLSNQLITTPINVTGKARGSWFFEGTFPSKVVDANGNTLGQTPLEAKGNWQTSEFVNFSGKLPFSTPQTETGTVVFMRENPSGLPENDAEVRIPVRFK